MLVSDRTAFAKKSLGALVTLDKVFELVVAAHPGSRPPLPASAENNLIFSGPIEDLVGRVSFGIPIVSVVVFGAP